MNSSVRSIKIKIIAVILFPVLNVQFIVDRIESNTHLREDKECQELIVEALKYQVLPERRSSLQNSRTRPRKSTVGSLFAVGGMDANKGGHINYYFIIFGTNLS